MKFVNDAFQINDEDEVLGLEEGEGVDDVLPPSYSETPRAGEQVVTIFSLLEGGEGGGGGGQDVGLKPFKMLG
jgi:hypothetical protein